MTRKELIAAALEAYGAETVYPHKGDTLALFVEREIGDARTRQEACTMMATAIGDLERVLVAMAKS